MKPNIGDTVQFKKSGIKGTVEKILRGVCIVDTPVSKLSAWPEDLIICGLSEVSLDKEMEEHQRICDEIMEIQGIKPIEAEIEEAKTYWDSIKDAWICPEGYQFVDENGNVINATKIVLEKKKKEYPKTYEECCKVLGVNSDNFLSIRNLYRDDGDEELTDYETDLLGKFDSLWELRICRDAYWKIAGEEMGLGKPWEPNWNDGEWKWCISYSCNCVEFDQYKSKHHTLAFPTAEMRDAFYENFKKEIEICKEFL